VTVATPIAHRTEDRWPAELPGGALEQLVLRSNLLGADRAVANFGGGNTSVKTREVDHAGRDVDVLWVKGSGSDLATMDAAGFTGLRLEEILPLYEREAMSDEEMVAYLARCQLEPSMPRCSIETLLHAFVPAPHVDHTHPDAINAIAGAADGEALARACFGDEAAWIDYIRPGFTLARQVGEAIRADDRVRIVILAKHGLVTWGDSGQESYRATIEAINRAADFVNERTNGSPRFGGAGNGGLDDQRREELLAELLPALRGAVSSARAKVLHVDTSPTVLELLGSERAPDLVTVGAPCPDHLVHTKRLPLWVPFDPARDDAGALAERIAAGAAAYRDDYRAYVERFGDAATVPADPDPRVVLVQHVGLVAVTAEESFAIEYWPLELYKLSLAPPPRELEGRVALVTGAAGGIGRAIVSALADAGACVVAFDLDAEGARDVVAPLGEAGLGLSGDVTDETLVSDAYAAAVERFGGVDIVVSNAGLASSAPIVGTTLAEWERNHAVLGTGYFLTAREAFRLFQHQGTGGSIVFVASKNALVAGRNAAAYSSAKAAELHLARCLAEEGGPDGIRVNTVNPDAVLSGSRIWDSSWREERAASYGIEPDQLEEHYRARTTLGVNIEPEDIAAAVLHFASDARSGKTTGNLLNVDGGVAAAYPR
jgi:rhamnose utilization protein RhaD (predicted bifunctional aldolase and dehydrogenase)/NAD(P)-dependent dehydrogenase (short-subunit alcohol dehydrogenase family)